MLILPESVSTTPKVQKLLALQDSGLHTTGQYDNKYIFLESVFSP